MKTAPCAGLARRWRAAAGLVGGWSLLAVLLALQGWLTGRSSGDAPPWWDSLGYALAIFSIWAALTLPFLALVRRIEGCGLGRPPRATIYVAAAPAAAIVHAVLFVAVFWPLYNDAGRLGRLEMVERVFVRNVGTDILAYAVLVAVGVAQVRRSTPPLPTPAPALHARSRGVVRILPLDEVDWIRAAGNYAEAHGQSGALFLDEGLSSLARRLPPDQFARIHRQTIVRLDRITEVRSLGRGDAEVRLRSGSTLRLSRRYRAPVSAWLARR